MDALKFLELYAEGNFDLIFADPPYAKSSADRDFATELLRNPALAGALRSSPVSACLMWPVGRGLLHGVRRNR